MAKLLSPPTSSNSQGPNRAQRRRRYIRLDAAAEYLDVSVQTIRNMIADGRLTGYRSSHQLVRVDLDELDAAMKPFGGKA